MKRFVLSMAAGAVVLVAGAAAAAEVQWRPNQGDTVVILGNTFAERMGMFGYFETFLHARFPEHKLRIRNMGWSADEVAFQPRPHLFGDLQQKLSPPRKNIDPKETWFQGVGADALICCFGMNEAFRGEAGLPQFRKDLDAYLKRHLGSKYNGQTAPRILLVSPIAHENLGPPLPDGIEHNRGLALYTQAMKQIASANGVAFVDLFTPHQRHLLRNPDRPLTFNGIHLTEYGDWLVSQWMAKQLGLFEGRPAAAGDRKLAHTFRNLVHRKNDRFWIHFRAVNGEYIYGRRRKIWAQDVAMIPDAEMLRLMEVDEEYDRKVWAAKKPEPAEVWADRPKNP